jgi:hypothetical protein
LRAHVAGRGREAAGVGERPAEQELDLGVRTPEVVAGPAGQGIVDRWVEAQQKLLAFGRHRLAHW